MPWRLWAGVALALMLYGVFFWVLRDGAEERSWRELVLGCGALVIAAMLLQLAFSRARRDGRLQPGRWLIPLLILAASIPGVVQFVAGADHGPIGSFGVASMCAAYLSLGQLLAELRCRAWPRANGAWVIVGCVALFFAGIALCVVWDAKGLAASVLAVLLAPIGVTLTSEDVLRRRQDWLSGRGWIAACSVLAGTLGLWLLVDPPRLLLVILTLVIGVLVLCIASSTQADVLVVVTVIVVVASHGAASVSATSPQGRPALVALGDSYMSGEGARAFFARTNNPGENECRRAPTAYAQVVITEGLMPWLGSVRSHACSGAVAPDLWSDADLDHPPGDGRPQLELLADDPPDEVGFVVVSIGGNDAGFAMIGSACLAPGNCAQRGQLWLDRLERDVAPKVHRAYGEIDAAISSRWGEDVPVAAIPYPVPLTDSACRSSLLRDDEHRVLVRFVQQLNELIRHEAAGHGFAYAAPMAGALDRGLQICDGPLERIGMNHVELATVSGALDQVAHPGNWIHNSLHPNEAGHRAMAITLAGWAEQERRAGGDLLAGSLPGPAEHRPGNGFHAPRLDSVMENPPDRVCEESDGGHCRRKDSEWAITQLGKLLFAGALPLVALVAGWWWLSLAVIHRFRRRVADIGNRFANALFGSGRPPRPDGAGRPPPPPQPTTGHEEGSGPEHP